VLSVSLGGSSGFAERVSVGKLERRGFDLRSFRLMAIGMYTGKD